MPSLRRNLILLFLLTASSAYAQAPAPSTTTTVVQPQSSAAPRSLQSDHVDTLALTVSGGVSLGSYEAGKLYFLTDALRRSPGSSRIRVVSGASAGSANALIAATEACLPGFTQPEESLGYQAWVTVGLDDLFDARRVTSRSLFHVTALERSFSRIAKVLSKLPAQCEFAFSVATTRETAYQVELAKGLVAPRQTEYFEVHVAGRDRDPSRFTNFVDPTWSFERPILPLSDGTSPDGSSDLQAIGSSLLASAAFPVAFPPQNIQYCITPRPTGLPRSEALPSCRHATHDDAFVDGGIFDNTPLGRAQQLARRGLYLAADGEVRFRAMPSGGPEPPPNVLFAFVDPDLTRYDSPASEVRHEPEGLLGAVSHLTGQALATARSHELADLAERDPDALARTWIIRSSSPPIGNLLGAFFGFFERDFRDFDFYLGTYDTFVELRSHVGQSLGVDSHVRSVVAALEGRPKSLDRRYRKLGCLAAYFEPRTFGHLAPLCMSDDLRNFRILLQVSLDRLWSECRSQTMPEPGREPYDVCERARRGVAVPTVDPTFVVADRYRLPSESELDYVLRLLGSYRFEFRDLGLTRSDAFRARLVIRRHLDGMVTALANAQPNLTDRTVLLTVGRFAVNEVEYEPPRHRVYVLLGDSLAVGYLGRLGDMSSLYWNPDLRFASLRELLTDRQYYFTATPSLGIEWALLPLSSSVLQTSVGVRAGYQATSLDSLGLDACSAREANGDSRRCSQPVLQTPVNLSLFERVRMSVVPLFYPVPRGPDHAVFDLELGLGAELF